MIKESLSPRDKGNKGEELAIEFLKYRGYQIIKRNWKYENGEIDIIAQKQNLTIFVEVKTLYGKGKPESKVDEAKMEKISAGIEEWIAQNRWRKAVRFDIIAISIYKNGDYVIHHFIDVFSF